MRRIVCFYVAINLILVLRFSVAVTSLSLESLLNEESQCTQYVRNGFCPNSSAEYVSYPNASSQLMLTSLLDSARAFVDGVVDVQSQECGVAITSYFCDLLFPPCSNGMRNAMLTCPNCIATSTICQMVYQNISAIIASSNISMDPLLWELLQRLDSQCLSNTSACLMGPAMDPGTTPAPGLPLPLVYLVGGLAALFIIIIVVLEGVCCYCCCVPTKMKMADFEKGDFHVNSSMDYVYGQGTINERHMSRASMIKHAFFRRFTSLRKTQFQSSEESHSGLPEPYKSLLAHKKHLVFQHRKVSLEKCLTEGSISGLYSGTLLELGGGNAIIPLTVAVRTIDVNHNESVCIQMVDEVSKIADLMHPHILNPIGVAISVEKPLYIVYPFLENRDILTYFRMPESSPKSNVIPRISLIFQIVLGMEFLSSRGIVHRNLCAKSCLLDSSLTVKIGGFGTPESFTAACPYSLPADQEDRWKWMALELLNYIDQVDITCFSERTDVWAFGVTAWEVYTLLDPYDGKYLCDIIPQLEKGLRLQKPDNCLEPFYNLIVSCWDADPGKRPLFKDISLVVHQQMREAFQVGHYSSDDSGIADSGTNKKRNAVSTAEVSSMPLEKFDANAQPKAVIEPADDPNKDAYENIAALSNCEASDDDDNDDCYTSPSLWTGNDPYEEYTISVDSVGSRDSGKSGPSVGFSRSEKNVPIHSNYQNLLELNEGNEQL